MKPLIVVVGNKVDLVDERAVTDEELRKYTNILRNLSRPAHGRTQISKSYGQRNGNRGRACRKQWIWSRSRRQGTRRMFAIGFVSRLPRHKERFFRHSAVQPGRPFCRGSICAHVLDSSLSLVFNAVLLFEMFTRQRPLPAILDAGTVKLLC